MKFKKEKGYIYYQIADYIEAEIRDGRPGPGQRLAPQEKMATEFSVARGTIRQALGVLKKRGLIVMRRGLGAFVKDPLPPKR
jgi:DNA-binding GntR family transcriptional regulator